MKYAYRTQSTHKQHMITGLIVFIFIAIIAGLLSGCSADVSKQTNVTVGNVTYHDTTGEWHAESIGINRFDVRNANHQIAFAVTISSTGNAADKAKEYIAQFSVNIEPEEITIGENTWLMVSIMDGQTALFANDSDGGVVMVSSLFEDFDRIEPVIADLHIA